VQKREVNNEMGIEVYNFKEIAEDQQKESWNIFYKQNKNNFFKMRTYLDQEFEELSRSDQVNTNEVTSFRRKRKYSWNVDVVLVLLFSRWFIQILRYLVLDVI
jgi:hypothetical protein